MVHYQVIYIDMHISWKETRNRRVLRNSEIALFHTIYIMHPLEFGLLRRDDATGFRSRKGRKRLFVEHSGMLASRPNMMLQVPRNLGQDNANIISCEIK